MKLFSIINRKDLIVLSNKKRNLRKYSRRGRESQQGEAATVNGDRYRVMLIFEMLLATFDFNRLALRATQLKLRSMFCALFLKVALSAAELMSFGHLGATL